MSIVDQASENNPETNAIVAEMMRLTENRLGPRQRAILERVYAGESKVEIAQGLGVARRTVYNDFVKIREFAAESVRDEGSRRDGDTDQAEASKSKNFIRE